MKIAALILFVFAALAGALAWTVWRADTAPVTIPPNAMQLGQQELHQQLDETRQHEADVEKQAWNSMDQLVKLIQWHQHRIDRLTGNSQAAEVVAYDRGSIARIQTRINDLAAQEKVNELAAEEKAKEEALEAKAALKEEQKNAEKPVLKPTEKPNK